MNRLTSMRCNGIKSGYWSPAKKEDLVQRLGRYEDTGLEPEKIKKPTPAWISVDERQPDREFNEYKLANPYELGGLEMLVVVKWAKESTCLQYCGNGEWYDINGEPYPVAYWMPKPPVPQKEDN